MEGHGHLGGLVRAVDHGGPGLREDAEVVPERVARPWMSGGEDGVTEERALVEKADVGEKLHGSLPVLIHDPLELDEVAAGMRVDGDIQLARRVLAGTEQWLAARLHLRRVQHPAKAPLGRAIVRTDEFDRFLEGLLTDRGVV